MDELLKEAEIAHGHLCAGQVLGVRMAMLGCDRLGLYDPRGKDRKRLVTFVEIDRCATDAIAVVTGCRLGKRALKFRDWGKMAATFVDVKVAGRCASALASLPGKRRADCIRKSRTRISSRCWPIANFRKISCLASSGCRYRLAQKNFPATNRNAHSVLFAERASITTGISCATAKRYATAAPIQRHVITTPSNRGQRNNGF